MAGLAAALAMTIAAARPQACAQLARAPLESGRVVSAEARDGVCRVVLEMRPRAEARIGVQVWLPLSGWSGRYVQLGTGGFAGTIPTAGLAAETARGNVAAATDTGHAGEDGYDARWAAGRPDAVADYGYRSIKVAHDAALAVTSRVYGRGPQRRYYVGCSNGGRQAILAAERFPQDWDGVLAGAPAVRWTEQLSTFARIQHALAQPGGGIPLVMLSQIQAAAMAGRPLPGTPSQRATLALIARDFDPRRAAMAGTWDTWILNPDPTAKTQATLAEGFFRHMVLNRPDWRPEALTEADLRQAAALSPMLDATADLSAFRRRGGKLVIYTGLADTVVSPQSAIAYHKAAGGPDFTRLYLIPDMLHCQGGPGADAFGQSHVSPPAKADARHDIRRALEVWVEGGRAPGAITAVRYRDGDPAKGIAASRRIDPR